MSDRPPVFYYDGEPPPRARSRFVLVRRPELLPWLLFSCIGMCCFGVMCNNDSDDDIDPPSRRAATSQPPARQVNPPPGPVPYLEITHMSTKRIERSFIGGTFRYFFHLRNHGPVPFDGEVQIELIRTPEGIRGSATKTETFGTKRTCQVGWASYVYMESHVAPDVADMHGEYGLQFFRWRVTYYGRVIGEGIGELNGPYYDETD